MATKSDRVDKDQIIADPYVAVDWIISGINDRIYNSRNNIVSAFLNELFGLQESSWQEWTVDTDNPFFLLVKERVNKELVNRLADGIAAEVEAVLEKKLEAKALKTKIAREVSQSIIDSFNGEYADTIGKRYSEAIEKEVLNTIKKQFDAWEAFRKLYSKDPSED